MQKQTSAKREIVVTQSRRSFLLFIGTLDRCERVEGERANESGYARWRQQRLGNENKSYRGLKIFFAQEEAVSRENEKRFRHVINKRLS